MNKKWSRRTFLKTSTAAAISGILGLKSSSPVVDTHMHIWSDNESRFPFSHPFNDNFNPPPVAATVERLIEEMDQFGITQAILIQMISYGWDNRYIVDCLHRYPERFRAQGLIDPTDPNRAERFEYWMNQGLSGMRFSPMYYQDRDEWLNSRESYSLWEKAESREAVFNFFITTSQLPLLEDMVAKFPGVKVVIDHLSRIDLNSTDPKREFDKLLRLSKYPNVWVKLAELQIISATKEYPYQDTFPYVKYLNDSFGPDRLLWGTGFPGATRVQAGRLTLNKELNLIRNEIPFFTSRELDKIMGTNALEVWDF